MFPQKPPWNFVTYTNKTFLVEGGRDHQVLLLLAERLQFKWVELEVELHGKGVWPGLACFLHLGHCSRFQYFDPPERSQGSAFVETLGNKSFPGILGLISERVWVPQRLCQEHSGSVARHKEIVYRESEKNKLHKTRQFVSSEQTWLWVTSPSRTNEARRSSSPSSRSPTRAPS